MPGVTVIDQLIVKLGLDPRDFEKGQKQVAASVLDTEDAVRKSTDKSSSYIGKLSAKWLTFAGAVLAAKKIVNTIDDVAERTRRLGIDSKNYGLAANEMRNFENAVELMGGNADEARKSVAGLNKSIFEMVYNGQMSDSLVMLGRLGVEFQTATGHARDFKDVALDTADAIAKAQESGQMTRPEAFQYLQAAGFDQGTAQLLLGGRASAEAALNAQAQRRQVSDGDLDKADAIRRASIGKDQALEGAKIAGMDLAGGIQESVNGFIEKLASPGGVNNALEDLAHKAKNLGDRFDEWTIKNSGTTRGLRNNNPLNLRAVGDQKADRGGFRMFSKMEDGIKAADHQLDLYAKRGINTIEKIITTWAPPSENDTEAYIKDVTEYTGMKPGDTVDDSNRALVLAAMARHESGAGAPDSGAIADVLQGSAMATPYTGSSTPSPAAQAGGGASYTKVDIDRIEVNTQAKDAQAMAADMDSAVSRKLLASHAEQGAT